MICFECFPFHHYIQSIFVFRTLVNELCKNSALQTEKSLYLTSLYFPMIPSLCLSPQGGSPWFVDEKRSTAVTLLLQSRSLIPRFTACPKQMGDSGNWHHGLQHAVMALSPEIPHLYLSSCCLFECLLMPKLKKTPPPHRSLSAHKVMVCQDFKDVSKLLLQIWSYATLISHSIVC